MATGLLHYPGPIHSSSPAIDAGISYQQPRGVPLYGKILDDSPLMPVLNGLKQWASASRIDWSRRTSTPVPFPEEIEEGDIAKVAAYSMGLKEIGALCQMVNLDNPEDAFSALVALSAMVTRAHQKQQRAVMHSLTAAQLRRYAEEGHPQCRTVCIKLLLRLWGPQIPAVEFVNYLDDNERAVHEETALMILRSHIDDKDRLCEVAHAIHALRPTGRALQTIKGVVASMGSSEDPEVRDAMSIVLASLGFVSNASSLLLSAGAVPPLMKHKSATCDQVNHMVLHCLHCLTETEEGCYAVMDEGGSYHFIGELTGITSTGTYRETVFEDPDASKSTYLVEGIFKSLLTFAHTFSGKEELRALGAVQIAQNMMRTQEFSINPRATVIKERYALPMIDLLFR
ncbi:hypothetical protein BSKO_10366 [Bryopsis sp. KO-2023]|nr:hypothetical protein BSKO_10366 [Bryopsis sp. KO-2023]